MKVIIVGVAVALSVASVFAEGVGIAWRPPRVIARGGYARVHRLADGRYMCAYERGGDIFVKFAEDPLGAWKDERRVAATFRAKADGGEVPVHFANAEFAQLKSGRILLGVNLRPHGKRHDVHPYAIGVAASDDTGRTWGAPKVVYRAEDRKDGVLRGCYEPFFLELPDGRVQLYFANEWPYVEGKRRNQEITVMESADGGATWSAPRTASYKPRCRDGMSVGVIDGDSLLLAIETNGKGEHLHPELLRTPLAEPWKKPVGFPSGDRCRPLAVGTDFKVMKGGAPYLTATATKLVLSWQQSRPTKRDPEGLRTVHVAVAERGAFGDRTFVGDFTPPGLSHRSSLWNSLCPLEGDSFLLVSDVKGRVMVTKGEIVPNLTERVCWGASFPDPTLWRGKDGRYYAYATPGGENTLEYLVSDDGLKWEATGKRPFPKAEFAAIRKEWRWVWAPDRTTVGGEGRMYVSLVSPDVGSAIAAYRMKGDAGELYDPHIITDGRVTGIRDTIDPEVVTDPDTGRVWLFFGSIDMIHRIELTADGLAVKPGAKYVHVAGRSDREDRSRAKVYEGSYLYRHDGWWYLFVSAGWYAGPSYNLRVGRSRTLDGTFVDREGRPMTEGFSTPVLDTEQGSDFYGPGHNGDFLVGKDGVERVYYHCHWRKLDEGKHRPRVMLCRRLEWDSDGWPKLTRE